MDAGSHTHDELEVLVSARALDALDPADAAAVEAHLAGCESCRAAFDEALETAAALALSVPPSEPPANLRERILVAARATPQEEAAAAPAPVSAVAPARRRRRFSEIFTPSRNFAAAFALAAALLGVLYLSERDRASTLEAERDHSVLVSQALATPGAQVVALSGPGGAGGGAVVLAADRKPLVVSDLLPAPPGKVWEVWTIPPGGAPVSAGLMHGGADNVLQLDDAVGKGTTVAITAEPDDGTRHGGPTGSVALSGGLS
jgi:anti-sigma-K factor RskA